MNALLIDNAQLKEDNAQLREQVEAIEQKIETKYESGATLRKLPVFGEVFAPSTYFEYPSEEVFATMDSDISLSSIEFASFE